VDRETGKEEPIAAPARAYFYPRISPDGTRVALDVRDEKNDIWIWHFARQTLTPLTFHDGLDRMPVWAPLQDRLAFSSQRDGAAASLYWQAADGSGAAERLTTAAQEQFPMSFSPDGRHLLFVQAGNSYDLTMIAVGEADAQPTPVLASPSAEWNGEVAPGGRWLAYQSNESGRAEIYVRPFPDVDGTRIQVSTNGGTRPTWSRDGRELFYYLPPGIVHAVAVQTGATFKAGRPEVLFTGQYATPQVGRVYDVSPDGRRILLIKRGASEDQGEARQLVVVVNWFEELKNLAPAR
jgi:serine/threonine-protein kinase